jgi:VanZ family protein
LPHLLEDDPLHLNTGFFWSFLFCLWFMTILILALQSTSPASQSSFLAWDKFQHAAAFGLLALLAGRALEHWLPLTIAWLMAFILAVLLGGMVEVAQASLTTYRNGDWLDLLADAFGAGLVSATALLLRARGKK